MIRASLIRAILALAIFSLLTACTSRTPMKIVEYVDLNRFMGDWYVVANIPTFIEKGAHNAVETYALNDDGTVATTFRFRKGGFGGPVKTYRPKGFIRDTETNALWGMQFIWPIKGDYRVAYLDEDYRLTIIGRQARDYVWVMARDPEISDAEFESMKNKVGELGYDIGQLQRVPQRWPESGEESQ